MLAGVLVRDAVLYQAEYPVIDEVQGPPRNSPAAKEGYFAEPCLADLFFLLLIIAQWYVYNDIQGGVEFSPLKIYGELRKSKMAAISRDQTIN